MELIWVELCIFLNCGFNFEDFFTCVFLELHFSRVGYKTSKTWKCGSRGHTINVHFFAFIFSLSVKRWQQRSFTTLLRVLSFKYLVVGLFYGCSSKRITEKRVYPLPNYSSNYSSNNSTELFVNTWMKFKCLIN